MNKKPTILGFKPTDSDYKMVVEIIEQLKKNDETDLLYPNNSDVLKLGLRELHKKLIKPKKEKNTKKDV